MGITAVASRPRSRQISTAGGKPMLRGIHHLALVTDNMRMTLDFYVRVLGMPIVHGLRTPSRPLGASHTHGIGAPPYANIPHYFLDMGGDSLLAFFEYPKGIAKVDRDAIGAMQHVSFACGPTRYREILERLKANGIAINAGPLLVIPPAIHSFYFFDPNGIRLEISSDLDGDEEDLQVIQSCSMSETELRAELETISSDKAWIEDMVAARRLTVLDQARHRQPDCIAALVRIGGRGRHAPKAHGGKFIQPSTWRNGFRIPSPGPGYCLGAGGNG